MPPFLFCAGKKKIPDGGREFPEGIRLGRVPGDGCIRGPLKGGFPSILVANISSVMILFVIIPYWDFVITEDAWPAPLTTSLAGGTARSSGSENAGSRQPQLPEKLTVIAVLDARTLGNQSPGGRTFGQHGGLFTPYRRFQQELRSDSAWR